MTNEEFQRLMLEQFGILTKGQHEVQQSLVRIENDHGEKISALYDAREVQMDVNERILESLSRIESKLDKISLKVDAHESALKRAK